MSAIEPLCHLMGMTTSMFTREENVLLELELFSRVCEELKEIFKDQHRNFFCLMKFSSEKGEHMLETRFIQLIINDILSTEEYNLKA